MPMLYHLKEYQQAAADAFAQWLDALAQAADPASSGGAGAGESVSDFPRRAWERLAANGLTADPDAEYISRTDDAGRPIPHICFKIPTGGGKTLLAAAMLQRRQRQRGLALWLTPTRAIYHQTRTALRDREHPIRQMLEIGCGGRVKLLEKDDAFTAADITGYLCVMLLSLPAANRQRNREFLRMFRDSGRYLSFFPDGDDADAELALLERHPDLDRMEPDSTFAKRSLFNVMKILRPAVVLDEAHKAYGAGNRAAGLEFAQAVSRLNPSLVIELSATPNPGISNLLVNIGGPDLAREEMIKQPTQIYACPSGEWRETLTAAAGKLDELDAVAQLLSAGDQADGANYIRPIGIARVERTGRDQRDGRWVHAEDAREHLQRLGVSPNAIRVKSSSMDELRRENLLSKYSPVRWIVTKDALMEGWDCPFAYVLALLDTTSASRPMTQMVGRVLRQPYVRYTPRPELNRCYVYCRYSEVKEAAALVQAGLERDGITGLTPEPALDPDGSLSLRVRQETAGTASKSNRDPGAGRRKQQPERERKVDWTKVHLPPRLTIPAATAGFAEDYDYGDDAPELAPEQGLELSWFARRLSDLIGNPWQGARLTGDLISQLRADGISDIAISRQRNRMLAALREFAKSAAADLPIDISSKCG